MKQHIQADLVSIIMPVYNAGLFLDECLNSIVNQDYTHWELLAVDDFSTDNSKDVLRAFAQNDPRIKVLENTSKGIIPALNLAYSQTRGKWITRMDSDDLMHVSKIRFLAEALFSQPKGCTTAKVEYFSTSILKDGYKRYALWLNQLIDNQSHYEHIYKECVVPSPCWMMSKETIEQIGGITDDRYPEDYDMCFRLYKQQIPIIGIDKILHLWRDHGARASRNDPHYADQHFIPLKLKYFLEVDYDQKKELILWGAGKTGKLWAKALQSKNITFQWITGNTNKIDHVIYEVKIQSDDLLQNVENKQLIVAIKEKGFEQKKGAQIDQLLRSNTMFFMY